MAFSPARQALYCFCCCLFERRNQQSGLCSVEGFSTWWKLNPKIAQHESSVQHLEKFMQWKELELRLETNSTIDVNEQRALVSERKKWRDVLIRLLDVIMFLAKQNLPLRGHRETVLPASHPGECNRGNFLELVHLLSKYDRTLTEHVVKDKLDKKRRDLHLSPLIQNEFIADLGSREPNTFLSCSTAHQISVTKIRPVKSYVT